MNYFVAAWSSEGFECVIDITKWSPEVLHMEIAQAELTGQPRPNSAELNHMLNAMIYRARFNGHRNAEVYAFMAANDVHEDDLRNWSETNPQTLVDWIRENGEALYSNPARTEKPAIV